MKLDCVLCGSTEGGYKKSAKEIKADSRPPDEVFLENFVEQSMNQKNKLEVRINLSKLFLRGYSELRKEHNFDLRF